MALISAYIISKNHEWSIRRAIRSALAIVSEVVVIDYGSTDSTIALARQLNAEVISSDYISKFEQKGIAEKICKSNWLLFLNGNEEITSALQCEIGYIFQGDLQDLYKAYSMKVVVMGRTDFEKRNLAYSRTSIRLYNKIFSDPYYKNENIEADDIALYDVYSAKNDVYELDHDILSRPGITLDYLVDHANFSSSITASSAKWKHKHPPSVIKILMHTLFTWFNVYFLRRYFIFGFSGFVDSCIFAFGKFLHIVKIIENLIRQKKR